MARFHIWLTCVAILLIFPLVNPYPTACPGCLETSCSRAGYCGTGTCQMCDEPLYQPIGCGSGGSYCAIQTTAAPSVQTTSPTVSPTMEPTIVSVPPTAAPSGVTSDPSISPTRLPTVPPTKDPSNSPTGATLSPTDAPSQATSAPSVSPTDAPTVPLLIPFDADMSGGGYDVQATKFTMSANGVTTTLGTGDPVFFESPPIGTSVTITMHYTAIGPPTYCPGCVRQFLFRADGVTRACNSLSSGSKTISFSFVADGGHKSLYTGTDLQYSCSNSGKLAPWYIGYIGAATTAAPTETPTTGAPTISSLPPSSSPTAVTGTPTFAQPTTATDAPTLNTFAPSVNTFAPSLASLSPTITTGAPSFPIQPTVAPLTGLHLVIRYTDKSWAAFYSFAFYQPSEYADILKNGLDAAFQSMYSHWIMYSNNDNWISKAWIRGGMINVNFCRFSDVEPEDDECPFYAANEGEYVAVAVIDVSANGGLGEYVRYLRKSVREPSYYTALDEQMALLNAKYFAVSSIDIIDTTGDDIFNTRGTDDAAVFFGAFIQTPLVLLSFLYVF